MSDIDTEDGEVMLAEVASKSDWTRVFVDHVGPTTAYEVVARQRTASREPGPTYTGRGSSLVHACRVVLMQMRGAA